MDRQKIFDTAFTGLRNQGFRRSLRFSANRDNCAYKTPTGLSALSGTVSPTTSMP